MIIMNITSVATKQQ